MTPPASSSGAQPMNVCVLGAGSAYGIFLVKWALQLKNDPKTNREGIAIPPIGGISYSNTNERNKSLVLEVLLNDMARMPAFAKTKPEALIKEVRGYTNWREMVQKENPGLVVICSPVQTHVPYLRELLTDFKVRSILCEPPLGHLQEVESLQNVIQLAQEKGVQVGVNQQYSILYDRLRNVPLNPAAKAGAKFGDLITQATGLEITFITHGTRVWRKMQGVGEQEILEDLGPHVYELIPRELRDKQLTVKDVRKEGDNLFLNFVEYDLRLGHIPLKVTLGYHRKLKSLKVVFKKDKKDYEFHISGTINPETGEFTRWIEGKNYAYYFKHLLNTDLVKTSFMSSLAGQPIAPIQEGVKSVAFIRSLYSR